MPLDHKPPPLRERNTRLAARLRRLLEIALFPVNREVSIDHGKFQI
jgi:hypothetical protein